MTKFPRHQQSQGDARLIQTCHRPRSSEICIKFDLYNIILNINGCNSDNKTQYFNDSFIVLSIESVRGFPDSWTDQGLFNAVAVKFIGARKRLG